MVSEPYVLEIIQFHTFDSFYKLFHLNKHYFLYIDNDDLNHNIQLNSIISDIFVF